MVVGILALLLGLSGLIVAWISWSLWQAAARPPEPDVDLLYALTHDISNPLQEILATLANMTASAPQDERLWKQDIESIHSATSHLAELTANFKSLALLDSPDIHGQSRVVDMAGLVQSVIINMGNMAEREGVRLTYQGKDTSPKIWGNESDFERVLNNLVNNGIKYRNQEAAQSEVVITVRCAEKSPKSTLLVEVEDNGIGMSERRVATIWARPFQPRSARTIGIQGTGLGLYLAKKIIEKYHGKVSVDSQIGRGTRFVMRFPIVHSTQ